MRCVVLDVDALAHASGLGLIPLVEVLLNSLPEKAYVERSVYVESVRSGVARRLDDWQRAGLVREPVDYRKLDGAEARFREAKRRWPGLSRQDRASLVVAEFYRPSGLLTCEKLLSAAAEECDVFAIDLFDIIRFGVKLGNLNEAAARGACAEWDRDPYRAGRPNGYSGSFDAEVAARERRKPLP